MEYGQRPAIERLFTDGPHPAIERLCGIVIALVVEQSCQVVEAGTGIGMVWSESLFPDGQRLAKERLCGCCQSNANQSPNIKIMRISRRQLTPFGQGGGSVLFEFVTTVEMAFDVEVVVDRGMNGSEFLQGLHVPNFRHRAFPSPEWLV